MIEVTQAHENADYKVVVDGAPLCTVAVVYGPGRYGYHGPDWPATKARAEHVAEALRHYQQVSAPKPAHVVWPKPRPISDAPTDGTPVIAYWSEQEYPRMRGLRWGVAKYGSGLVWFNEHNEPLSTPTHFLPLPPSPEVK